MPSPNRIWGHLTSMSPPVRERPEEPTVGANGVPLAHVMEVYAQAVDHYMVDLVDYDAWPADEARAT
jgi:hypothetical protein